MSREPIGAAAVWEQDFWLFLVMKVVRHKDEQQSRERPVLPDIIGMNSKVRN